MVADGSDVVDDVVAALFLLVVLVVATSTIPTYFKLSYQCFEHSNAECVCVGTTATFS